MKKTVRSCVRISDSFVLFTSALTVRETINRYFLFSHLFVFLLIGLFMTDASDAYSVYSLLPLTDGTFLSGHGDGKIRRYDIKSRSLICTVNGIVKEVIDC